MANLYLSDVKPKRYKYRRGGRVDDDEPVVYAPNQLTTTRHRIPSRYPSDVLPNPGQNIRLTSGESGRMVGWAKDDNQPVMATPNGDYFAFTPQTWLPEVEVKGKRHLPTDGLDKMFVGMMAAPLAAYGLPAFANSAIGAAVMPYLEGAGTLYGMYNAPKHIGETIDNISNGQYWNAIGSGAEAGLDLLGAGFGGYNAYKNLGGLERLQNAYPAIFDPYTSWDATLGYYGNNIGSRLLGTLGRRANVTPKAQFPELHRRINLSNPDDFRLTNDGKIILSSGRTGDGHEGIVNMATSEAARSHQRHKRLSGIDDFIINPKAVEGQQFISLQPSDTFFKTDQFAVDPQHLTFVSGNPELLTKAKKLGIKTLSSPRLRKLDSSYKDIESFAGSLTARLNYVNKAFSNSAEKGREIQRLTSMRGAPTLQDYAFAEAQTGLNSGVVPNTPWNLYNAKDIFGRYGYVRGGAPKFNNVVYDPASNIEAIYRKAVVSGKQEDWDRFWKVSRNFPSATAQSNGLGFYFPYRYGGAIHIKPENRGKFTATMKRTGKSAEELSHSSNPLTRKRAIFALNARKWHH